MAAGIPLGPYVLVRRLATGGMAEIFLARREGPEGFARDLVVKRILPHLAQDPAFTQMFLEEARIAARLTHPNVVQVYDFGEVEGSWYLAMELVRGVDLRALIERSVRQAYHERRPGAIPAHHAAKIMSLVCEGLAHAHAVVIDGQSAGLVHRDVSPSNVLISFEGAVKVADFGIAKADTKKGRDDTRIGLVKGKYAYMSPEQARGERLDARSDLFNVGTLLFESITGDTLMPHHDYRASKLMSAAGRIPNPERLDQLPPELAKVCHRALAAEREHRYPDALALRADLEAFLRACPEPSDQVEIGRYVRSLFADVMEEDKRAPRAAGTVPQTDAIGAVALDATMIDPLGPTAHAKKNVGPRQADVKTDPMTPETPRPLPPLRGMPEPVRSRRPAVLVAAGAAVLAVLGFAIGWAMLRADAAPETPALPPEGPPPPDPSAVGPPPPPPSELRVTSNPPGLDVYVDGERVGPAPLVLTLSANEPHRIELRGDGGVLSSEEVTLEPGAPSTLELAPTPPRLASLRVVTLPESATVRVDGEERGETPIAIEIEPGEHEVEVTAEGYEPQTAIASLSNANETATLSFVLVEQPPARTGRPRPPRATGTLVIATTPWSEVYLRGRRLGTTPLGNVQLPAGRHTLTLRAEGRPPRRHTVTIRPDEETRVRLAL